ncbi:MAG: hypothetical protein JOZ18_06330 [Chloroflexi bacterium]|nr:hypothetical protein [Chloroflexota bacterium]
MKKSRRESWANHAVGGGRKDEPAPCPKIVRGEDRLTPEQEEYTHRFAQERIAAILSTTAIDTSVAEKYLRRAYHVVGLERPRIRWFASPMALAMATTGISVWDTRTWDAILLGLEDSVEESVRLGVSSSLWDHIKINVWQRIESIGANIGDGISNGIGEIEVNLRLNLWRQVRFWQAYEHESWLAFYRFFSDVFEPNALIHLAMLNEMVSGYCLGRDEAWLVHKPTRLEYDAQGRLHSATNTCIEYADGWGFYARHGVRVSDDTL